MADIALPPLFIVGAPRSGTSLVRNLVRTCEGVYLPPDETQFFPAYFEKVAHGADVNLLVSFLNRTAFSTNMRRRGIWPSKLELAGILKDRDPESAIPELMKYLARRELQPSFRLWGDKTPKYVYFLDVFRNAFPNMRVLFVIRDPRDAVLSMREAWGRSLIRSAMAWRDAAQIALANAHTHGPTATMAVHYEALATDPVGIMADIANWLGVKFSAAAVGVYAGKENWGAVSGAGIVSTSIGRYRKGLSRPDTELVERIAFDEMQSWGYPPEFAKDSKTPAVFRMQCARFADGLRSLARYVTERGLVDGVSYKLRQFFVTRRGGGA